MGVLSGGDMLGSFFLHSLGAHSLGNSLRLPALQLPLSCLLLLPPLCSVDLYVSVQRTFIDKAFPNPADKLSPTGAYVILEHHALFLHGP